MKNLSSGLMVAMTAVLLFSCKSENKDKVEPVVYETPKVEFQHQEEDLTDIVDWGGNPSAKEKTKEAQRDKKPATNRSSTSTARRTHRSSASDNMRGFDPASEDDMDDNGMSRYMENTDDEGWD